MGETNNGSGGHRQRLRSRFARSGLSGLQDYEIIELLLTYAIPRKDVKPLAKLLLEKFHNISGLLNASGNDLLSTPGIGTQTAMLFRLIHEIMVKSLEEGVRANPVFNNRKDISDFLRMKIGSSPKETLMVFYLDSGRKLLGVWEQSGTVNNAAVAPREIAEKALLLHAAGVILAHNHPSGSCAPSQSDVNFTRTMFNALELLGIQLLDHIIVTHDHYKSLMH
jgi:DNA repair protein RadC